MSPEEILQQMGITPLWVLRGQDPAPVAEDGPGSEESAGTIARTPEPPPAVAAGAAPEGEPRVPAGVPAPILSLDWPGLEAAVSACRACVLCEKRQQAVLGVGDRNPDWLFIGEGPGAEEDEQGEPFVGQAGKLLDAMLAAIDLERGRGVYIGNAVKCRPPGNRNPEAAEMAACHPYLERQIQLLQPKLIVLLGRVAMHSVLGQDRPLGAMRGRRHEYLLDGRPIPVVVTYHPAYLLRNLPEKARAWEDLCFARRLLAEVRRGG